jgi:hypothetical protein
VAAHNWVICKKRDMVGARPFNQCPILELVPGLGEYAVKSALGLLVGRRVCSSSHRSALTGGIMIR